MENKKMVNEIDVEGLLNVCRKCNYIALPLKDHKKLIKYKNAIEIIKTKQVDVKVLLVIFINNEALEEHKGLLLYNSITRNPKMHLTKEEYSFLKEVLND